MMRCIQIILFLIFSLLLVGCLSTKTMKGNEYYWLERKGAYSDVLHRSRLLEDYDVKVSEHDDYLQLEFSDTAKLKVDELETRVDITGGKEKDKRGLKYYKFYKEDKTKEFFRYKTGQVSLQALSIPIKIHPATQSNGIEYPAQTEANFNVGIALGIKYGINKFFSSKNKFWNTNTVTYSLTPGAFINLGATSLDADNAPGITKKVTLPTFSCGGVLLLGINSFHIGYALGVDNILGKEKEFYIYQNQLWYGFIISVDVAKF